MNGISNETKSDDKIKYPGPVDIRLNSYQITNLCELLKTIRMIPGNPFDTGDWYCETLNLLNEIVVNWSEVYNGPNKPIEQQLQWFNILFVKRSKIVEGEDFIEHSIKQCTDVGALKTYLIQLEGQHKYTMLNSEVGNQTARQIELVKEQILQLQIP